MIKNIRHHSAGVAIVEFAIILPLLVVILAGITELGRALYQQNTLYKSVSAGARYLARAANVIDKTTCVLPTGTAAEATARNLVIYGEKAATGSPLLPNLDSADDTVAQITISSNLEDDFPKTDLDGVSVTEDICVISINAEVNFKGIFGEIVIPFSTIGTFKIRAETEERYIGL